MVIDNSSHGNYNSSHGNYFWRLTLYTLADFRNVINQLEKAVEEIAKHHDVEHLAGPQGQVLHYLCRHEGDEVFVKDIEKYMKSSKSVASNLVKRMEKNGFIKIVPSDVDKRFKQVLVTELGRSKLQPLKSWYDDMVQQLYANISYEEFQVVQSVFEKLETNIAVFKENKDV